MNFVNVVKIKVRDNSSGSKKLCMNNNSDQTGCKPHLPPPSFFFISFLKVLLNPLKRFKWQSSIYSACLFQRTNEPVVNKTKQLI